MNTSKKYQDSSTDILLVDDNVENLRILTAVLRDEGYKSRQVKSGKRALEAAAKRVPDLILLDVEMPGLSGFEVCRRIKENQETSSVPIIFITAQSSLDSKIEGFKAGGSDYITKPFQIEEVLARVGHQLQIQALSRGIDRKKKQLEIILETLPLPYVISRPDGTIYDCNEHALELFGVKREDVAKIEASDFYNKPEERESLMEQLQKETSIHNREIILKKSNDQPFYALLSASIFELEDGVLIFIGVTDITERKQLEHELEKLAMTDPLTEIHNRRSFFIAADQQITLARRQNIPLTVLSLDIDHFKQINDTWGHDVGDMALIHFVEIVKKCLRSSDIFGRLGGEEFSLLLLDADTHGASVLGERIRTKIEHSPLSIHDKQDITMTFSGGLALWNEEDSLDTVLAQADKALFKAKEAGRNRIVVSN